ncbi:MFS transporter [Enterococcus entomosocium]|uniref:MFS transporter n=1 Tax=Enterococcus entomosocium TaxID=3034352 RepID=UPI003D6B320C
MKKNISQKRVLLSILATGILIFCGMVIETAMNIVFPTLMKEFNINTSTVQWMTTSYLLVVSIIVPISTYLKKQFKTKSLFIFASMLFIAGVIIASFAFNFPVLLCGRVIQGIGTGIALPLMFNIIIDEVPQEKLGIMMAIGTLVTAIGPAIGPTLGGVISHYLNWRFIFILLIPLLILSLIIGIINISQSTPLDKHSFDFKSFVFIPVMFIGLVYGLGNVSNYGFFNVQTLIPLFAGIAGLVGFVMRCLYVNIPIINIKIFSNKKFTIHVISFMLIQITLLGLGFLLPNFTQIVLEKNELTAALQLLAGAIIGAIFTMFSGQILDTLGASLPIKAGTTFILLSIISFTIFHSSLTVLLIVIIYSIFMLGVGLSLGNIMTSGIKIVQDQHKSDGNAIFNIAQQFSGALGTTLASTIVALTQTGQVGSITYRQSTALGTKNAFIVMALLVILACLATWTVFRKNKQVR